MHFCVMNFRNDVKLITIFFWAIWNLRKLKKTKLEFVRPPFEYDANDPIKYMKKKNEEVRYI